jgi:hypothetical protein
VPNSPKCSIIECGREAVALVAYDTTPDHEAPSYFYLWHCATQYHDFALHDLAPDGSEHAYTDFDDITL